MTIIGNSNHPVTVKKISLEIWTLKDELKAIVRTKLSKIKKKGKGKIDLKDILQIYEGEKKEETVTEEVSEQPEVATDSAGNPLDEAALEMAAALAGDDDQTEEATEEVKAEEATEEKKEEIKTEEVAAEKETEEKKEEITEKKEEDEEEEHNTSPFRQRPEIPPENIVNGVLFLADINMDDILFFSKKSFVPGQSIAIKLLIPNEFIIGAEVITCEHHNTRSRIISDSRPPYRIRSKLVLPTTGERTLLRNFLKSIEPEKPKSASKKAAAPKADDFDDLDDLEL